MTEDISSETLAGGDKNVPSTDGNKETASEVTGNSAPLHEVLNEALGTTFKSPEDAVLGLKNTQSYVGKLGKYQKAVEAVVNAKGISEDAAVKFIMDTVETKEETKVETKVEEPKVDTSKFVSREEFDKTLFFKDNANLAPYAEILNALAASTGKPLAEAAKSETFQQLVTAKEAQDESEKSKSVLTSSPRLGNVADKMTEAREASKAGNQASANKAATQAVIDAFGLK